MGVKEYTYDGEKIIIKEISALTFLMNNKLGVGGGKLRGQNMHFILFGELTYKGGNFPKVFIP